MPQEAAEPLVCANRERRHWLRIIDLFDDAVAETLMGAFEMVVLDAFADAERFVRSIKEECLFRMIVFGEEGVAVWSPVRRENRVHAEIPQDPTCFS